MIALPIIGFIIAYFYNVDPAFKVGLIILAGAPGGTTSGLITYLFRGNLALAIAMTTINSLLILFSLPFLTNLAMSWFMNSGGNFTLSYSDTVKEVFLYTLLPASLGMFTRHYFTRIAENINRFSKPFLLILLAVAITLQVIGKSDSDVSGLSLDETWQLLPMTLLLNIACMFFGFFVAKYFKLGYQNQLTISIESGVHNTSLAFVIAISILKAPEMAKPTLVYSLFSFWTAIIFCYGTRLYYGLGTVKADALKIWKVIILPYFITKKTITLGAEITEKSYHFTEKAIKNTSRKVRRRSFKKRKK